MRPPVTKTTEPDMRLPEGKTCGECAVYSYCFALFGCNTASTVCDWAPCRFRSKVPPAPPAGVGKEGA